jgi:hypothetical protein
MLTGIGRRHPHLLAGRSCELRVGRDVFELGGDGRELSIAAGSARSPDAVIALEPDVFYGLATGQITPRAARERAALEGANEIATRVLDAISAAVAYGKLYG